MSKNVAVIGPQAPPFGGMANQGVLLTDGLVEKGLNPVRIRTNYSYPELEKKISGIPGVRTVVRIAVYLFNLVWLGSKCEIFHIMACSHLYYVVNVIPALIAGHLMGKRVVLNYRGGEAKIFFNGKGKRLVRSLHLADSLIVPSQYLKDLFKGFGLESVVVPNIIPLERFRFRLPGENQAQGRVTYICTRQFEPYYDVATLVKAFALVKNELSDARLILVGEGRLYSDLKRLAAELNIESGIHFAGKVNAEDIPDHLNRADIFVNSSVVDNYPNSILEAFAAGLPVITTDAGGIVYLVKHGKNGLLVKTSDYKSMAKEMVSLAKSSALKRQLARGGEKTAEKHSWDKIWMQLKEEYQPSESKGKGE